MYEQISRDIRKNRIIAKADLLVGITEHLLDDQTRVAVLINYSSEAKHLSVNPQEGWKIVDVWYGGLSAIEENRTTFTLVSNEGTIIKLQRKNC